MLILLYVLVFGVSPIEENKNDITFQVKPAFQFPAIETNSELSPKNPKKRKSNLVPQWFSNNYISRKIRKQTEVIEITESSSKLHNEVSNPVDIFVKKKSTPRTESSRTKTSISNQEENLDRTKKWLSSLPEVNSGDVNQTVTNTHKNRFKNSSENTIFPYISEMTIHYDSREGAKTSLSGESITNNPLCPFFKGKDLSRSNSTYSTEFR